MKEPKVAIYIRLSLADEDTHRTKEESDSVQHQRLLIHDFLNRHAELKDAPRTEFVDDGFSGVEPCLFVNLHHNACHGVGSYSLFATHAVRPVSAPAARSGVRYNAGQ